MSKRLMYTDKHYLCRQGLGLITIKGMMARSAGLYPFKIALQIRRGEEFYKVTYRELKERMDQLESGLIKKGIKVKLDEAGIERILKEEIRQQCRRLAEYKRVKHFSVREEEFPKTTTRKIKRYLFVGKKVPV
ncbi:MAG: hypothetical protein QME74_06930 [Candidatus Edwardsbacteria bacterium]|nr:hypothetical protein [Candidatus Edwardsbacteria bacterium]